MNSELFVRAINNYVVKPSVGEVIDAVLKPWRRRPSKEELDLSKWLNSLSSEELNNVRALASKVAETTAFGILVVIDGERKIDESEGTFRLLYQNGADQEELEDLHDEFGALL